MKNKKKVNKKTSRKKELRAVILEEGDEDITTFEYVFGFFDDKVMRTRYMCYDDISDMRYDGWTEDSILSLLDLEKDKYKKYFY